MLSFELRDLKLKLDNILADGRGISIKAILAEMGPQLESAAEKAAQLEATVVSQAVRLTRRALDGNRGQA